MNKIKAILKKLTKPTMISVGILVAVVGIIVFTSGILYTRTSQILDTNLRERLLSIVTTASVEFDPHDVEQLHVEEDWKKPEWAKVVHQMEKIRKNNPNILFVYMFRKTDVDPTKMEFVSDSHSIDPYGKIDLNGDGTIDDQDQLQWPGQPYDVTDIPEAFEAYNGPITNKDIYSDQWGPVLTGYAPIKDENGTVVAILAVDIKAGDFATITKQTLEPFLIFIASLSLIISILILIIIYFWKKYEKYLQETNEKLKELDKLKTEFLSLASHQLRSPLTAMKGYSSMLIEGDFGEINPKAKEAVERIFQSTMNLTKIVEDFLNVSKIESGGMKYVMAPFSLVEIARDMAKDLSITANQKGLKLNFESDLDALGVVNGDREKIRQVVLNFIDNSIKYTKEGEVNVSVKKVGNKVVFAVKDTGMGMTPEIKATLFQKFARGDGARMNTGGSGLGLYLAKEIIEAHKGTVDVTSEGMGKGSTFSFTLDSANAPTV